jgi:hypothetical protein
MANVACYNNIFSSTGGIRMIHVPAVFTTQNPKFIGNLYWGNGSAAGFFYGGARNSLADFRSAGVFCEKNGTANTGLEADPLLTNINKQPLTVAPLAPQFLDAFRLQSSSPAINAAIDLSAFAGIAPGTRDFFGNARGTGLAADIGAHEMSMGTASADIRASDRGFVIYPNPVQTVAIIRTSAQDPDDGFRVYDGCGRFMTYLHASDRILDTHDLSPGVYTVTARFQGIPFQVSIVKY